MDGYVERFHDPRRMWEAEAHRAEAIVDWPTDGIPTVRPNLGVVFIPVVAGQDYVLRVGQMPWPGRPMSREAIRAIPSLEITSTEFMRYVAEFYAIHGAEGRGEIAAYHPDTQSVFDVAHLLNGKEIFFEVYDDPAWVHELMEISLDLYRTGDLVVEGTAARVCVGNDPRPRDTQGVFFPCGGARTSEDTATLLSPEMIDTFVLPYMERAIDPFSGGFVHFCGRHQPLFERLCRSPLVRAIDLGNSEKYDLRWLLERCAASGTVLYSRVAALPEEDWRSYTERVAGLIRETGARCILRPMVYPDARSDCAEMLALWHELTDL